MCDTLLLRAVRQLHLAGAEELKQLSAWPGPNHSAWAFLEWSAYGKGLQAVSLCVLTSYWVYTLFGPLEL